MSDRVLLNLFLTPYGYHEASWVVSPVAEPGRLGFDAFRAVAQASERGLIDSLFIADVPYLAPPRAWFMTQAWFDPVDVLASLASVTDHIGLMATGSTTFNNPWDLARRFATLDHLSGGRAGWNIVTTASGLVASNFNDLAYPEHDERYERATEFVEVVLKVWDSWDDGAVVADRTTGVWADRTKLHAPAHRGTHYAVAGHLTVPRPPQGHPLLVQAGSSDAGIALASRFAEMVFTPQSRLEEGVAFRDRIRTAARAAGRSANEVCTLPGLSFLLASTEAEAHAEYAELEAASSEEFRLHNLLLIAGLDSSHLDSIDPDGAFPYAVFETSTSHTFAAAVMRVARENGFTFRQAAHRFAELPGGLHLTGTPEQLAVLIEQWWRAGAADGFTLQPLRCPADLNRFADHVMPLLQARGIAQREYQPGTLRDKLGLPRPANVHRR